MNAKRNQVIGFFAYSSAKEVVCSGDGCVIADSRHAMEEYLREIDPMRAKQNTIRKRTFEEIKRGLLLGGAYAFDKGSYTRFYPLAKQEGLDVKDVDFEKHKARGIRFLEIKLKEP